MTDHALPIRHHQVTDAVAGSKSACEFYGRASQAGQPSLLDHRNPQHGLTVTYAGGRCVPTFSKMACSRPFD